jgi:hypothetical protein
MLRKLSSFEILIVELVHYLSYGDQKEMGLTLRETKNYLQKSIPHKNGKNCLECLEMEGLTFINELKIYMNELKDY